MTLLGYTALFGDLALKWPWMLLFLLLVPFLFIWYTQRQRGYHAEMTVSTAAGFQGETSWKAGWRPFLQFLRILAIISLILALARPLTVSKEENIKAEGIDIVMVMDVSSSMLSKDFQPDRLEASKKVAGEFVDKREHDRVGLVVFAGESYTQCPLTSDHTIVKRFLDQLQCGLIADGTAIGMGLANGVKRLQDSESKSKVVILLTDGVNNAGYTSPMQAADAAKKLGVKVYTIGVGTQGRARAPIARRPNGSYVFGWTEVEIDEKLLQRISEETGGQYFRATDAATLEDIYAQIDELEKTEIETTTIVHEEERFHGFIFFAMLMLGLELLLAQTIFRTILE